MKTYLVLPAWTGVAGQLHIVAKESQGALSLANYRANPDGWAHAGLVDAYSGTLRCLNAPRAVWDDFKSCEPIRPPLVIVEN